MTHRDVRGNPCSSAHAVAREAAERALWRLMSFYDTPLADLDTATAADPGWALPHIMRAGFLLSLTEPGVVAEAQAHLLTARSLQQQAAPRERAHLEAVQAVLEGRWQAACHMWDALLVDHPHDALALQWAQLWDFYRGDANSLRLRPARALPQWDHHDPLYPYVLALWAFGLEECNLYPQAEEAGRRALDINPCVPWAVHAVAHVMEMQGRFEDGAAWLRQRQTAWGQGNGFAGHLWWHKALFRLEALDFAGVMRLVDNQLSGDKLQITLQRVDAASMLWRLHLMGQDVSAPFTALAQGWGLVEGPASPAPGTTGATPAGTAPIPGNYAFNDVHAVLALLGAGQAARAEAWVARCAEQALKPSDASRNNHAMAREVGLPLMRGLCALERGNADAAVALMAPVLPRAARLGGSQAQRDLISQTLLAATAKTQQRNLGRALLNERLMAKPETPLTRFWAEALALPGQGPTGPWPQAADQGGDSRAVAVQREDRPRNLETRDL